MRTHEVVEPDGDWQDVYAELRPRFRALYPALRGRRRRYGRAVKAVLIERPNEVALVELETPSPDPGEVLVEESRRRGVPAPISRCSTAASLIRAGCASRSCRATSGAAPSPSSARACTDLEVGERVVCEGMIPCNRCRRCKEGNTQLCLNYDQIGFTRPGGYGEFVRVPRHVVHRLPERVSFAAGASSNRRPVSSAGSSGDDRARATRSASIGVGTLGSLALKLANLYSPGALRCLRRPRGGADLRARVSARTRPRTSPSKTLWRPLTSCSGGGLDLVLETAGAAAAVDLATRLVRPGGRVVLLGIAGEGKMLEIPADRIMFADMDVVGSCSYPTSAWSSVVRLLEHGLLDLDRIVTHRFPARPLRGGVRAHGQPRRPRREGRSRAPERLARRPVLRLSSYDNHKAGQSDTKVLGSPALSSRRRAKEGSVESEDLGAPEPKGMDADERREMIVDRRQMLKRAGLGAAALAVPAAVMATPSMGAVADALAPTASSSRTRSGSSCSSTT